MGGRKQKKFVSMPPQTCFPCEMYSNALESESRVHKQAVSKDFPRKKRNLSTFKNTVSLFKRGVNFLCIRLENPLELNALRCFLLAGASAPGSRGSLWLGPTWWDGDKYPTLSRINKPKTQPQWRRTRLRLDRKTKQNKKGDAARKRDIHFMPPSVCLPPVTHDHYHGGRHWGLSRPHLYQQAGIKLSNYPPRPLAWPWTPIPFASLACSQTLQAGMWKHILMTALFQSRVFVIVLVSLDTRCSTGPAQ